MATFTVWVLIKRHRNGYVVTAMGVPIGGVDQENPHDSVTEHCRTLEEAKELGPKLGATIQHRIVARDDIVLAIDTSIENG